MGPQCLRTLSFHSKAIVHSCPFRIRFLYLLLQKMLIYEINVGLRRYDRRELWRQLQPWGPLVDLLVWQSPRHVCIWSLSAPGNSRGFVMGNVPWINFFHPVTLDIQSLLSWPLGIQICLSGTRLTLSLTKSFDIIISAHAGVWKRQSVLLHSTRSSPHIERGFVLTMSTNVSELCIEN